MTQKNKDLLLQDLCGRLPYGVRFPMKIWDDKEGKIVEKIAELDIYNKSGYVVGTIVNGPVKEYVGEIVKPYLFPLSSMTEEQYESLRESGILSNCSHSYEYVNHHIHGVSFIFKEFKTYSLELIEWLNKNHFDYRGLIPMGLAIDSTELKIY